MTPEESGDRPQFQATNGEAETSEAAEAEYDPQFTPIVTLPEVEVPTHEEDETEILKLRAKLYRFDRSNTVPEWKERGTGEVKMLRHDVNKTVRVVMRRDKTLKVCANHFITPVMDLKPKLGQDRVFVYTSPADFTYETVLGETFAIKFGTVEFATQFKNAFLKAQKYVSEECKLYNGKAEEEEAAELAAALEEVYEDSDSDDDEYENNSYNEEENQENLKKTGTDDSAEITTTKLKDADSVTDELQKLQLQVKDE